MKEIRPSESLKARTKKKKERKISTAGKALLQGKIYTGSKVVADLAKRREIVLYQDRLGGFTGHHNGKKLMDKVWVLAAHHKMDSIKRRKFSIQEQEKKSLLSILTSHHYSESELFTFSIKSDTQARNGKPTSEKLVLAFESHDEAVQWRQGIADQIAAVRRRRTPQIPAGASRIRIEITESSEAESNGQDSPPPEELPRIEVPVEKSLPSEPVGGDESAQAGEGALGLAGPRSSPKSTVTTQDSANDGMATPTAAMGSIFDDEDDRMSITDRTTSLEALHAELRADSGPDLHNWMVIGTDNNVTVLKGIGEHNHTSVMLSYIIRAPPRLCVRTVLKRDHDKIQMGTLSMSSEIVEVVDNFNDVLETTWQPAGFRKLLVAPRKVLLRRLWRREDDGTYVILFKALGYQHQPHTWWLDWMYPHALRISSGMTFSPLTSEYSHDSESQETLVTVVLELEEYASWWIHLNPLHWFLPYTLCNGYIGTIVQQCVAIRTKAEAARFSVRPFLQSHEPKHREEGDENLSANGVPLVSPPSPLVERSSPPPPPPSSFDDATTTPLLAPVSSFKIASQSPRIPEDSEEEEYEEAHEGDVPRNMTNGHASTSDSLSPKDVATCDAKYWSCPGATDLRVRGKNYLQDRKKIAAAEPVFELVAADLLQVPQNTPNIARFLPSLKHSKAPFTFIVQVMFGSPCLSLTYSWAAPSLESQRSLSNGILSQAMSGAIDSSDDADFATAEKELLDKPFELTLARFLAGGTNDTAANRRRDGVLKLVPHVSKGPWFVKQAVGTTPCLLGRKLRAEYHRGPGYFEVDLDVNSSSVAANIVGLVQGMTKRLWVDMAIVLEGHTIEELPEVLLGTIRFANLDLNSAKLLDPETGKITDKPGTGS